VQKLKKTLGEIIEIDGFNCYHSVSTIYGSSGSPLINENFKVIGIHKRNVTNCCKIYEKLTENQNNIFSKNNAINYATKIDIVEYAIKLFYK